jgi:hypothetical protein
MNLEENKSQVIKKRYTKLMTQYEALNEQYDDCLDAGQKALLKPRIDDLQAELEVLNGLISQTEKSPLLEKLQYIDFRNIVRQFEKLLDCLGQQGGTSLLILQDSQAMAGDLLVMRLQEELRRQASTYHYYPVGFSEDNELSIFGFLKRLSTHFGVSNKSDDIDELLGIVIEKICTLLQTRSIIFVEITQWHRLPDPDNVLDWLCNTFYPTLIKKLSEAIQEKKIRRVYVFLAVVSDDYFPDDCLDGICPFLIDEDGLRQLGEERIFDVTLENWTRDDIEDWLEFAGLPDDQLESTANRLFRRGRQGIPLIVRDAIEKEFCSTQSP